MQGIIGAFLGFLISLLISLVLNQPGAIQNISRLTAQPVYILFIIISTFGGGAVGYLCKTINFSADHKREDNNPGKSSNWAADVIVVVFAILFALVVYVYSKEMHILYCFILPVILLWFFYRILGTILSFFKADKSKDNSKTSGE
jgi:MFS family permease